MTFLRSVPVAARVQEYDYKNVWQTAMSASDGWTEGVGFRKFETCETVTYQRYSRYFAHTLSNR